MTHSPQARPQTDAGLAALDIDEVAVRLTRVGFLLDVLEDLALGNGAPDMNATWAEREKHSGRVEAVLEGMKFCLADGVRLAEWRAMRLRTEHAFKAEGLAVPSRRHA